MIGDTHAKPAHWMRRRDRAGRRRDRAGNGRTGPRRAAMSDPRDEASEPPDRPHAPALPMAVAPSSPPVSDPQRAIRPGPGRIAGATRWTPEITLPGPKSRDTLDDHVGEGHRHATIRAALAAPGTAAACTLSPGRPHEDALRLHHVGPRRPTPVPLDAPPDPRRIRNLSSRIITPRRLKRIRPSPFDVEDLDATTCVPPAPV